MRFFRAISVLAFVGALMVSSSAFATILLPDPTSTVDGGIPVAHQYDQFYSYDANLLAAMQGNNVLPAPYASVNYQFSMGTGTLPVIVYTGSNGATNPTPFANPDQAPNGNVSTFDDTGVGANSGTPWDTGKVGTVGALETLIGSNIPILVFDNNQNSNGDLFGSGFIRICDSSGNNCQQWNFDTNNNGQFDKTDQAEACGTLNIGPTASGAAPCNINIPTAGHEYSVNNNNGSGKPDFFIVPIGLDLNDFASTDIFEVGMYLTGLDGGFEEMDLAGLQVTPTPVPEPSSLFLLGAALFGFGALGSYRRRDKSC